MKDTTTSYQKTSSFVVFAACILLIVSQAQSHDRVEIRQDPFRPIIKPQSISPKPKSLPAVTRKISPKPTPQDPKLKLLGVVSGQHGRRAVLQNSSGKRMVVGPGVEVAQSGWKIKAIRQKDVLLEFSPSSRSEVGAAQPGTVVLSFPALEKS